MVLKHQFQKYFAVKGNSSANSCTVIVDYFLRITAVNIIARYSLLISVLQIIKYHCIQEWFTSLEVRKCRSARYLTVPAMTLLLYGHLCCRS